MSSSIFGVPLLTPAGLTSLALTAVKADLEKDLAGACLRWELSRSVGMIIKDLTAEQIAQMARRSGGLYALRLQRGDNVAYWQDMARALNNSDSAGADMSLVSAILNAPMSAAA